LLWSVVTGDGARARAPRAPRALPCAVYTTHTRYRDARDDAGRARRRRFRARGTTTICRCLSIPWDLTDALFVVLRHADRACGLCRTPLRLVAAHATATADGRSLRIRRVSQALNKHSLPYKTMDSMPRFFSQPPGSAWTGRVWRCATRGTPSYAHVTLDIRLLHTCFPQRAYTRLPGGRKRTYTISTTNALFSLRRGQTFYTSHLARSRLARSLGRDGGTATKRRTRGSFWMTCVSPLHAHSVHMTFTIPTPLRGLRHTDSQPRCRSSSMPRSLPTRRATTRHCIHQRAPVAGFRRFVAGFVPVSLCTCNCRATWANAAALTAPAF